MDTQYDIDLTKLAREIRAVETRAAALLSQFGLENWKVVVVYEEDDLGDEDDIRGSYGRCYFSDKLIWVNGGYADSPELVDEIVRHEIAHALLGGGADHGPEFVAMAKKVGCTPTASRGETYPVL
ncbi:MAG TPA: SprT-like domain-containing protein [Candidatus Acidoferrum sp.]|nr:SprT-like domain-containing protein [Candidatus Acidoferrum sp.]